MNVSESATVNDQPGTPLHDVESALEYLNLLIEATREAQDQIQTEIVRAPEAGFATRPLQIGKAFIAHHRKSPHSK
jgi:hypothetical protein